MGNQQTSEDDSIEQRIAVYVVANRMQIHANGSLEKVLDTFWNDHTMQPVTVDEEEIYGRVDAVLHNIPYTRDDDF